MDSTSDCRVCGGPLSHEQTRKRRPFCSQRCCGQHKAAVAKVRADIVLTAGEKPCTKCGQTKRLDDFYEDRSKLDGRRNSCIRCDLDYQKQPIPRERRRAWNHTEAGTAAQRRYYYEGNGKQVRRAYATRPDRILKNRESQKEAGRKWYQRVKNTPEYQQRVNSEERRERRREYQREWSKRPDVAERRRPCHVAGVTLRRYRKHQLPSSFTLADWRKACAYFDHCCAYCGRGLRLTRDHFIPVTGGGAFTPENVVPACVRCNCSKQDRDPQTWCRPEAYQRIMVYFESLIA